MKRAHSPASMSSKYQPTWKKSSDAKKPYKKKDPSFRTPYDLFAEHKAATGCKHDFCGFHYHSARLANLGTSFIYDIMQKQFQEKAENNAINWSDTKELLFTLKKMLDAKYRNIMYHGMMGGHCHKCKYWDKIYTEYLSSRACNSNSSSFEISDQEMLAIMEESKNAST